MAQVATYSGPYKTVSFFFQTDFEKNLNYNYIRVQNDFGHVFKVCVSLFINFCDYLLYLKCALTIMSYIYYIVTL